MSKKILLVGPMPSTVASGVSLGFQSLVDGVGQAGLPHRVVSTASSQEGHRSGGFSVPRLVTSLRCVASAYWHIPWCDVLYMTVGSSRLGFARDSLFIWYARIFGKGIVLHLKGGGYKEFYDGQPVALRWAIRNTLAQCSRIVVLGDLLRDQFEFVPRIEEKLRVVPNGLPVGLAVPQRARKALPQRTERLKLLYLSNLIVSKGYLTVLETSVLLAQEGVEFECHFCGAFAKTIVDDDAQEAYQGKDSFEARVRAFGLENRVFYHGTVTGSLKEEMLNTSHLLLLPTRYPWEGQPISILEALAYATPVIATKFKGIPEQVLDGYNGYLVPPGNAAALRAAIRDATRNDATYGDLSAAARTHYERHFTRDVHLQRMIDVICGGAD